MLEEVNQLNLAHQNSLKYITKRNRKILHASLKKTSEHYSNDEPRKILLDKPLSFKILKIFSCYSWAFYKLCKQLDGKYKLPRIV